MFYLFKTIKEYEAELRRKEDEAAREEDRISK